MRLRPERPDLQDHVQRFDVPAAAPDSALTVTWAVVSALLVGDGSSALMTDGSFSRPGLTSVGLRRIAPCAPRVDGCLTRLADIDGVPLHLPQL